MLRSLPRSCWCQLSSAVRVPCMEAVYPYVIKNQACALKIFHHTESLNQWESSIDIPRPMRVEQAECGPRPEPQVDYLFMITDHWRSGETKTRQALMTGVWDKTQGVGLIDTCRPIYLWIWTLHPTSAFVGPQLWVKIILVIFSDYYVESGFVSDHPNKV